jgi:hypothetical protein
MFLVQGIYVLGPLHVATSDINHRFFLFGVGILSRNKAALATSSGSAVRPIGC